MNTSRLKAFSMNASSILIMSPQMSSIRIHGESGEVLCPQPREGGRGVLALYELGYPISGISGVSVSVSVRGTGQHYLQCHPRHTHTHTPLEIGSKYLVA